MWKTPAEIAESERARLAHEAHVAGVQGTVWGQSAERQPCTVCGKPYAEHGTYPTCASHPYSQDGRCGHIGTFADGKFTGAPCAGAECRNGCVRAAGVREDVK